jgi:hypothetical protein
MQTLEFPHCHKPAIPVWRKLVLGPAVSAKCKVCGGAVGVPWSAMWVGIPFFVAIIIAALIDSVPIAAALWIAGFAAMSWLHYRYVPLVAA